MDREDSENLRIIKENVAQMLVIMERPKALFVRIIEGVAMGIGILSVLSAIDILRNWLGG